LFCFVFSLIVCFLFCFLSLLEYNFEV
jgi:hypothetical protein